MMIFACVNKATFIYLQSLGKALLSTVLSMVREVVFGVGFALLLPLFSAWTVCFTPCRYQIFSPFWFLRQSSGTHTGH